MKKCLLLLAILALSLTHPANTFAFTTHQLTETSFWNFRIEGASASDQFGWGYGETLIYKDINNDDRKDLIITNSQTDTGSVYIILSSKFENFTGTGNTLDLSDSNDYNLRINGPISSSYLGDNGIEVADLDSDGKLDIIVGAYGAAYNSRTDSGSLYVISNSLINSLLGSTTGKTVSLSASSNFNIRFDGPSANDYFVWGDTELLDYDADGKLDIAVGNSYADFNSKADSGSVYIINNNLFSGLTGTGNTVDMATSSNWSIRFDGASAGDYLGDVQEVEVINLSSDRPDLILGAYGTGYNSRATSGSMYIIKNSILNSFTGTGNTVDMSDTSYFNVRYDGSESGNNGQLSYGALAAEDIDRNGVDDILVSQPFDEGNLYIITDTMVNSYTGTGNTVDLADGSSYNSKISGANSNDNLSYLGIHVDDINNDQRPDLLLGSVSDYNSLTDSGSVFAFFNGLLPSGTGNQFSTSNTSRYSFRMDGPSSTAFFGRPTLYTEDINGDQSKDFIVGAYFSSPNGRSNSGAIYFIFNNPHSLTLDATSSPRKNTPPAITGNATALDPTRLISKVQWSADNKSFNGTWTDCTADDSSFSSSNEDFTCTPTSLAEGSHSIYFRALNSDDVYTPVDRYPSVNFLIDTTPPTGAFTLSSGKLIISATDENPLVDAVSGVSEMLISTDSDFTNATWEPFQDSKLISTLNNTSSNVLGTSTEDSGKVYYMKLKDAAGNESQVIALGGSGIGGTSTLPSTLPDSGLDKTTFFLFAGLVFISISAYSLWKGGIPKWKTLKKKA